MIVAKGLWKRYDTITAVRGVDLELAVGRTLGLIGPNGSGKTTLLRLLSTLAKPDEGTLTVCGHDALSSPREVRRRLSFMPAEFGVPGDLTIGEFMRYFACAADVPRERRAAHIADILVLTDLTGREEVLVRGLSTGNKQRLLFAKSLLGDPELLIFDEPASGLDPRARAEVRALLKELARMGKTIVISSHILADLDDICSEICILEAGERKVAGDLAALRESYARSAETPAAGPRRVFRLRVPPADADRARAIAAALPGVLGVAGQGETLEVALAEENANQLLRALLAEDIGIHELRAERPDLEAIFLRSTEGRVT